MWRSAVLAADSQEDRSWYLKVLLESLRATKPPNSSFDGKDVDCSPLLGELILVSGKSPSWNDIPEELAALTMLTALTIQHHPNQVRLEQLERLSALTALKSLKVDAALTAFPPEVLNQLQQLTQLNLHQQSRPSDALGVIKLGAAHSSTCTALRRLEVEGIVLTLSRQEARMVWEATLQHFSIAPASRSQNAGFWDALPSLSQLTSLSIDGFTNELSGRVNALLPACQALQQLHLGQYTGEAIAQLPSSLTRLSVSGSEQLRLLPASPRLRSLRLHMCTSLAEAPPEVVDLVHLTSLQLVQCQLRELPQGVAALPRLEVVDLSGNEALSELPLGLACLPSLRELCLSACGFSRVPSVLGGGQATSLELLDMSGCVDLTLDDAGLAVLSSLTALTCLKWNDVPLGEGGRDEARLRYALPQGCDLECGEVEL
ncbi:hypothetical protein N2152v2_002316 [Parachlorella kessleri]